MYYYIFQGFVSIYFQSVTSECIFNYFEFNSLHNPVSEGKCQLLNKLFRLEANRSGFSSQTLCFTEGQYSAQIKFQVVTPNGCTCGRQRFKSTQIFCVHGKIAHRNCIETEETPRKSNQCLIIRTFIGPYNIRTIYAYVHLRTYIHSHKCGSCGIFPLSRLLLCALLKYV